MAEADDKVVKKPAASLSLVMAVEKQEKKAAPFPAVKLASLWALLAAAILVGAFAFAMLTPSWHPSSLGSLRGKTAELTGAAAKERGAIGDWVPWCTAAQAAAAAAALLLLDRRRRSRGALAYAALAATATAHLMCARVVTLYLAADPGNIFWWTVGTADIFFFAAADITCFLALLGILKHFS